MSTYIKTYCTHAVYSATEVKVAKIYLFLLPFRMFKPLSFLTDIMGPLANYADTIFLALGLLLWFNNDSSFRIPDTDRSLYTTTKNSILYLNFSSLVMATVMFIIYGDYHGHSPFLGIVPMALFYFQYLLMFLYNIRVFTILSYNSIVRVLSLCCNVLLVIGYIQVAVMIGVGSGIYDAIVNVTGGLIDSAQMSKLSLTATEGAGAGTLLGVFVFPFLFAQYIYGDSKALVKIALWMIPLFFTHSTVAYSLFAIDLVIFAYLLFKTSKLDKVIFKFLWIGLVVGVGYAILSMNGLIQADAVDQINYLLFEKAYDSQNGSTASRTVPFIINWGCFTEMPLLGVGNGLQGYYYMKYFPTYLLDVQGTDLGIFLERIKETGKIANGGTFIPGYFSGYGIAGIIVLINFVLKLRQTRRQKAQFLGLFNAMFIMGSVAFFIAGLSGEMYCLYYAWFVLSIPFMVFSRQEDCPQRKKCLQ